MTDDRAKLSPLAYLSGLQKALVDASKRFLSVKPGELDETITEVLGLVGAYCAVDRSYLFRFNPGTMQLDNTHEWCAPGTTPQIDSLQGLHRDLAPRAMEMMERREVVHIPRVADLPPDWTEEKTLFGEQQIQSLVLAPIFLDDRLYGFAGFDSVRQDRQWAEEEIGLLGVLGDLIGSLLEREASANALRRSEHLRSNAERLANLGSWAWNLESDRFDPSREWRRVTGCWAEPLFIDEVLELVLPQDRAEVEQQLNAAIEENIPYDIEHRIRRRDDGETRWIKVHAEVGNQPDQGRVMWGFAQDITERKRIESAVAESEARYRSVVNNIREVVFQADAEGKWTFLNQAWERLTGFSVRETLHRPCIEFMHPEDRVGMEREFAEVLSGRKNELRSEARFMNRRNQPLWFELNVSAAPGQKGGSDEFSGTLRDFTSQREAEYKLRELARFDPVTGLPNRTLALDRLRQSIKRARRRKEQVAVLFMDLDRFKKANDTLGHQAGDHLIRQAAGRIVAEMREQDTVARLGGDEFMVVVDDLSDDVDAQPVAEKLLKMFREPFQLEGREFLITASIGIAIAPQDGVSAEELLRNADIAMYQSKGAGRDNYHYFTQDMDRTVARRQSVEEQLRGALARNELFLAFQPIVDLRTGAVVGSEALSRWNHEDLGPISPDEFIPVAEQSGVIDVLGEHVLRQSLAQVARWRVCRDPDFWISVNFSAQQFRNPRLVATVERALAAHGLPGEALHVEITESALVDERSRVVRSLQQLKDLGVSIAMDDFGTGYASLSYLRHLPFDTLKIDRSFVGDLPENEKDIELVIAAISLAHSLKLTALAEGVEREDQAAVLKEYGCELAQGYLYGKPMSARDFDDVMPNVIPQHSDDA